jgi:hypothetical protein
MPFTIGAVPSFSQYAVVLNHDTTYKWIGFGITPAAFCQFKTAAHPISVVNSFQGASKIRLPIFAAP